MPIYDYTCTNCGKFEINKNMDSPDPTKCPHCGLTGLRRIFSAPSFSIRGEHLRVDRPKATPPAGTTIQPRSS